MNITHTTSIPSYTNFVRPSYSLAARWLSNTVQLVRTGVTTGLSQPITFESIKNQLNVAYDPKADIVTTSFVTPVDFAIVLEKREIETGGTNLNLRQSCARLARAWC
jgi:hypothetical protein